MCARLKAKAQEQLVHLADNEWGNELMLKVATELLDQHRDDPYYFVTVYEHAGWFLSYARIDGEIRIVSTANDAAVFPDVVRNWWKQVNQETSGYIHVPAIRR